MARTKPSNVTYIRDVQHADQVMGEMAEIKRSIEQIEGEMNAAIDQAKAASDARAEPLRKRLSAMENGLAVFAEHNREALFAAKRTLEMVFGAMGFRKSTELTTVAKTTWAMVLGRLKELAFSEAIRIKEEANKDVMREWPDERLTLVGARRVEKDTFWYELKKEDLGGGV
ncbi:MAG: host-nuclease inhibitor Gam family protein [Magnetococcales bacterium]|nr:host-nuclease inhibitor Gam family protein [Magnetococcales bacterium]